MNKRRKIVVNASTVLISGGYYLSLEIIHALIDSNKFELFIICPSERKYLSCKTENSSLFVVPRWKLKRIFRLFLDNIWLPKLIRKLNPNLVFSLTNIPAKTQYHQVFLHDNPFFGERNLKQFKLSPLQIFIHELRSYVIRKRLFYVNLLLVQSEYHKNKIQNLSSTNLRIKIISPPAPFFPKKFLNENVELLSNEKNNILCLSRYYDHKNLEILLEVGELVKQQNLHFKFLLTLNSNQSRKVRHFLKQIQVHKLSDTIINLGAIKHENIQAVINQCDSLILPSLLESFSLIFTEAWALKKPVFTSNIPSIKSVCRDSVFYFNPNSAKDILDQLKQFSANEENLEEMIARGHTRLKELPERDEYVKLIVNEYDSKS